MKAIYSEFYDKDNKLPCKKILGIPIIRYRVIFYQGKYFCEMCIQKKFILFPKWLFVRDILDDGSGNGRIVCFTCGGDAKDYVKSLCNGSSKILILAD